MIEGYPYTHQQVVTEIHSGSYCCVELIENIREVLVVIGQIFVQNSN